MSEEDYLLKLKKIKRNLFVGVGIPLILGFISTCAYFFYNNFSLPKDKKEIESVERMSKQHSTQLYELMIGQAKEQEQHKYFNEKLESINQDQKELAKGMFELMKYLKTHE